MQAHPVPGVPLVGWVQARSISQATEPVQIKMKSRKGMERGSFLVDSVDHLFLAQAISSTTITSEDDCRAMIFSIVLLPMLRLVAACDHCLLQATPVPMAGALGAPSLVEVGYTRSRARLRHPCCVQYFSHSGGFAEHQRTGEEGCWGRWTWESPQRLFRLWSGCQFDCWTAILAQIPMNASWQTCIATRFGRASFKSLRLHARDDAHFRMFFFNGTVRTIQEHIFSAESFSHLFNAENIPEILCNFPVAVWNDSN